MIFTFTHLIEAIVVCLVVIAGILVFRKSLGRGILLALTAVLIWSAVFSGYLTDVIKPTSETLTITALETKDEQAQSDQIHIHGIKANHQAFAIDAPASGNWVWAPDEFLVGWLTGDPRQPADATPSITFQIPAGTNRKIQFSTYPWCGYAQVSLGDFSQTVDTYSAEKGVLNFDLPDSAAAVVEQFNRARLPLWILIFLLCASLLFGIGLFFSKKERREKIEKYKFLFGQLVKRDFTLKYKRTVLGMLWSVLSPLINLLIMWLVFNGIFGSNVDHFVIYLFAGQLIFTYFNDATNQGMASLLENSSIFTKINVSKYMFLLSKNVSSLINFGITLIIFFIFVAFEGLPFTWMYVMLLYPIGCLILFNLGIGLILSAVYVFFRDTQYLWGIVTQLIMWLSATFYSIDSYPQYAQNLFLLNPVYLFIRYFRKIVIEGQVPSIWFHLLMAGFSIVALLIGCRIYKKNNHNFLYYV